MTGERTSDYDFYLPESDRPTAARPARRESPDGGNRAAGTITHRAFRDIVELIEPRDVLVVNRTRVLRARLLGTRASGAPAEILLLKSIGGGEYEAMVSPGGKLKPGRRVDIAPGFSALRFSRSLSDGLE